MKFSSSIIQLVVALLAVTLPAYASDWYPTETGRLWIYSTPGSGSQSVIIEDPELFAGLFAQPLHWDSGVREYLSQDTAGRVFQHGVTYPDGGYVVFTSPILLMDSELTLDHQWETITDVIEYNSGGVEVFRLWERSTFRVIGIGPVEVPAGTFFAVEILHTIERNPIVQEAASPGTLSPSSAPHGALQGQYSTYAFRDAYAEGIGWIRRTDENGNSVLVELEACGVNGVPAEPSTWGKIKALYR